ncbi:hypothetical protein BH11MYX4_BH11MYX4_42000 [soil metagenome]
MPRKAQGTTFVSDGAVYASVTIAPGKRLARALQGIVQAGDDEGARTWATTLQRLVDALRAAGREHEIAEKVDVALEVGREHPSAGLGRVVAGIAKLKELAAPARIVETRSTSAMTLQKFGKRWTSGELHAEHPDHIREKRSAEKDAGVLAKHVYPVVGHVPLGRFSLRDAQEVMRRVPRELSSATRRQVAQVMVRLCNLAVYPCELIKVSPLPKGFLPRVRVRPGAYLYPSEEKALLRCKDVPIAHRLLYGFLAREGMRKEEALGLTWGALDLDRGVVRLDENKTDDPRAWALDPGVAKALAWWRKRNATAKPDALVFDAVVDPGHLAATLREHLALAGVDRAELSEHNAKRRQMNAHGLRATFVTIALASGKSETWVMDRTGHRSSTMVNRYRRIARTAAELGLGTLAPLNTAIPEIGKRPV